MACASRWWQKNDPRPPGEPASADTGDQGRIPPAGGPGKDWSQERFRAAAQAVEPLTVRVQRTNDPPNTESQI